MIFQDLNFDREQSSANIKKNALSLIKDTHFGNNRIRMQDLKYYSMYYGNYDRSKYDYIRSYAGRELPAIPRKINLQQVNVNVLISERSKRPLVGTPRIHSDEISKKQYNKEIREKLKLLMEMSRNKFYHLRGKIQQIEIQLKMMKQQLNKEPQNQEEVEALQKLQMQLPMIETQYALVIDQMNQEKTLSQDEVDQLENYYKYDYKDMYQIIADKIKAKIVDDTKLKDKDIQVFKSKCITGKPIYLVLSEEGRMVPTISKLNELNVTYPKVEGINRIQHGPWVYITDQISYDQLVHLYGKSFIDSYGEDKLKKLNEQQHNNNYESLMIATDDGKAIFMHDVISSDKQTSVVSGTGYSGDSQTGFNIKRKRLWYKAQRRVYIKISPNKHDPKTPFRHFVNPYKRLINKDEYRFNKKLNLYIHKNDKNRKFSADYVELYSKKKGEDYEHFFITDIYSAIIINDEYIVDEKLHDRICQDPDTADVNLPVFGYSFSNETEQATSPISLTADLQEMYDTLSLHREIAIAIAGAAGIVIDRSLRPTGMEDTEWEYHQKMGRLYIQTRDENGRLRSDFNQFQRYDNSVTQGITYIDSIMSNIEILMGLIMGVPRQRIGEVTSADQVGTYNASIKQASLVTQLMHYEVDILNGEVLEEAMNLFVQHHLQYHPDILDVGDFNLATGIGKTKINKDEVKRWFFRIYVQRETKDIDQVEMFKDVILQTTLRGQSGLDLSEVVSLFNMESLREMTEHYDRISKKAKEAQSLMRQKETEAEVNKEQNLEKIKGEIQKEIAMINNSMEQRKLEFDQNKAKVEAEAKDRELFINSKLKLLELVNEKASEDAVLENNDKHANIEHQLDLLNTRISTMLQSDKQEKDFKSALDKNDKDYKSKKLVKEHASDK